MCFLFERFFRSGDWFDCMHILRGWHVPSKYRNVWLLQLPYGYLPRDNRGGIIFELCQLFCGDVLFVNWLNDLPKLQR